MTAPFSDEDCVVAAYEVEEYDSSGDDSSWDTLEQGILSCPVFVHDGTGELLSRHHDDTTFDPDPAARTTPYVDSDSAGP